jgi:hypothetical protein
MNKNYIIPVLLFFAVSVHSQQVGPHISFDKQEHNFGELKESQGVAKHVFEFTNTGNEPLILNSVRASCGCTTPRYSREPVLPGARGTVQVNFNPKGRSGPFRKHITIASNAQESTVILHIKGSVLPGEKSLEEIYRYKMSDIRLKRRNIYIPKIGPKEQKSGEVEIVNVSGNPVNIAFKNVPDFIKMETVPEKLNPGDKGVIKATFDAATVNDWGSVNKWILFSTDGQSYSNRMVVSANIQEDFSKLSSEELASAPKASFSESRYDFGSIQPGQVVEHDFVLENKGKSDLIIRKVSASCGCTAVKPSKTLIKPGEQVPIKVKFNSRGRSGQQNKTVTVITNDPKNFKSILWIKGKIES